jgi:hypothetical protein
LSGDALRKVGVIRVHDSDSFAPHWLGSHWTAGAVSARTSFDVAATVCTMSAVTLRRSAAPVRSRTLGMRGRSFLVGDVDGSDRTGEALLTASGAVCKRPPTLMGCSV